ncbi:UNVERIFIED_CONTAM: hypothetical protein HHA_241175 [Hammondia hammondi]|eukprot:XP_008887799.1 hypothetical protein HHA_241175 [Hammondia hammondi]
MRRASHVCARPSFPFGLARKFHVVGATKSRDRRLRGSLCLVASDKTPVCFLSGAWFHPWTRTAWLLNLNHDGFCQSFWLVQIPLGCLCSRVSSR